MIKDIEITQGSTFEWLILVNDVNGVPLDMAGYAGVTAGVRGSIRKRYTDPTPLKSFAISILNNTGVLAAIAMGKCHLTTEQTAALVPDSSGSCYLLVILSAADTAALPKGDSVYDIEIEDTYGYVFKPFSGSCAVSPEATK